MPSTLVCLVLASGVKAADREEPMARAGTEELVKIDPVRTISNLARLECIDAVQSAGEVEVAGQQQTAAAPPPALVGSLMQRIGSWIAWNIPAWHAWYARKATRALNEQFRSEAESIGYVATFEPPPGWIPGTRQSMTDFWKDMGRDGKEAPAGVSLYSLGGPSEDQPGFMARVDRGSPDYQAWVGVYVCNRGGSRFWNRERVALDQIVELALHDQRAWLRAFGDPDPEAEMLWTNDESGVPLPPVRETIRVNGAEHAAYVLDIASHSDVFDPNGSINIFQSFMGHATRDSPGEQTHEPVTLRSYYVPFWVDEERGVYAVAYACGTKESFGEIKDKLRRSLESMRIEPVDG